MDRRELLAVASNADSDEEMRCEASRIGMQEESKTCANGANQISTIR